MNMKEVCCEDVGGPATALALNKATTQVAVAGRSVLKIYNIGDKGFEMSANLRVVKSVVASCNDVAWNQVDDSILATATPSGAVVIWNLNKPSFSKMDNVYSDHKRTVNKVHFHGNDPWLLLSGSQDSIKLFDLRQSEAVINYSGLSEPIRDLQFSPHRPNVFIAVQDSGYVQLYDVRKKDKFEQSFPGHNGPILACDWHPDHAEVVATAGRDMSIKVWTISGQTPVMQHCIPTMEAVSKIRWSNDNKNQIASCSLKRDYNINIWNILRPYIAYARFTEPHEITTGMAWRHNVTNLISVTSNGILYQLPMIDAYRPLDHANPVGMAINPDGDIALALGNGLLRAAAATAAAAAAAANSNNNTTTSTTNNNNNNSSSSQSSGQNVDLQNGGQSSRLPPTGASTGAGISSSGSTSQSGLTAGAAGGGGAAAAVLAGQGQNSLPNRLSSYQSPSLKGSRQSVTRRSQDSALTPRISSRSQLDVYKCTEMNWFVKTAQEYQLSNRPLGELCDHNAEVCARLRRFQICQTWKILKLFYANIATTTTTTTTTTTNQNSSSQAAAAAAAAAGQLAMLATTGHGSNPNIISSSSNRPSTSNQHLGDTLSINSQLHAVEPEISFISNNHHHHYANRNSMSQQIVSLDSALLDDNGSLAGSEQTNESTDEWLSHEILSYEAFQPKHDICGQFDRLMNKKLDDSRSTSDSSNHEDDNVMMQQQHQQQQANNNQLTLGGKSSMSTTIGSEHDLKISHLINTKAYQYRFYEIIADVIADVLKYHVDNSDVQSAVSILIVLGDRIKSIVNERIPEMDRESWYHSYIDLLSRFQLWNVMAQVINLSPLQNINSINQTSTTIYTTCGTCNRPLNGRVGWICERCKTKPSECSVCHGVVSGLMAWCQGCYHGGHLIHMNRWFSENDYCPTGCGHQCELSQWR